MPLAPQEIRTFFVTAVTARRRRLFQVHETSHLFMDVLAENRSKARLHLHAFVIMPDHIHLILTPAHEIPLEKTMQFLKGGFSFRLKSHLDVWEASFTEHRIKNALDYAQHVIYTEQNPVRARLALDARSFLFSSASNPTRVDPAPPHLTMSA